MLQKAGKAYRFTEFEPRQLDAVRKELDADYETDRPIRQDISAASFQQVRALTGSSAALRLSLIISPKLEKLAINKPFECRSAVVLSPSF